MVFLSSQLFSIISSPLSIIVLTPGSFYTSARLVYAAGRERYLPAMFGRLHKTRRTPLNATLLQAGITTTFIVVGGGFRSLINFSVVASWAFYFLTVCAPDITGDRGLTHDK
jgi:amino acid transporter